MLRLSVDCGEELEHLVLDVVFVNETARDLARGWTTGQRIWATGALRAVRRDTAEIAGRHGIEVMATEVAAESLGGESGNEDGFDPEA